MAGTIHIHSLEWGNEIRYDYDALKRLTEVIEPDPDDRGGLENPVIRYFHDDVVGNLTRRVDRRGRVRECSCDGQQFQMAEEDHDPW